MNSLMGIVLKDAPMVTHHVALSARDDESLLVSFLSELLYTAEMQGVAFDQVTVNCDRHALQAQLAGRPIAQQERLIKAVTYHGLSIQRRDGLLMVTIVLDV